MRRLVLAAGVGALLCTPAGVAADPIDEGPPIGSRLGKRVKPSAPGDERTGALAGHGMAYCLVHKHGKLVRDALGSVEPGRLGELMRRKVGDLYCSNPMLDGNDFVEGRRITYPPDVMRGMIAEQLVKLDRAKVGQLAPMPRQRVYVRPWYPATERPLAVDEMATCVAEIDPRGTLALIDTQPYSSKEQQAFAALVPQMGPCLTVGAELQANRQALRAALAEALYQRTQPWPVTQPEQPTEAGR